MTQVNSPYNLGKIRPIKLMSANMPRDFFFALDNYFQQSERVLQQIYLRVGGTSDAPGGTLELVEDAQTRIDVAISNISSLGKAVKDIESDNDIFLLLSKIKKLEGKIKELESNQDNYALAKLAKLEQRIKNIEES